MQAELIFHSRPARWFKPQVDRYDVPRLRWLSLKQFEAEKEKSIPASVNS